MVNRNLELYEMKPLALPFELLAHSLLAESGGHIFGFSAMLCQIVKQQGYSGLPFLEGQGQVGEVLVCGAEMLQKCTFPIGWICGSYTLVCRDAYLLQ